MEKHEDHASRTSGESDVSSPPHRWQLWRQDDNGIRALVAEYADEDLALKAMARFESHRHKQTYWIVEIKTPP